MEFKDTIGLILDRIEFLNDPLILSLAQYKAREMFDSGELPKHALILGKVKIYGYGDVHYLSSRFEYPVDPSWMDLETLVKVHNEPQIKIF